MKNQASTSSSLEQTSPDIVSQLSAKDAFFSFHTAMNLYKAYSLGGPAHAGIVAVTSVADGMLSSSNITDRNYFSLSSFWGYVGWSAIKQIQLSEKIPTSYKVSLYTASSLIGVGMVCLGTDIFASKTNNKTLDSVKLLAGFFDKTNEIHKLEE